MTSKALMKSYLNVPRRFPYTGLTVGQQLYESADKFTDKEMFVFYADNERITFKTMKEKSQQFAASLLSMGLKKGDTIAVWGANHSEWLIALFASTQLGILLVPLRLEFTLATVITLLKKVQCKALLLTRSPSNIFDKACEIIPELNNTFSGDFKCQSFPELQFVIMCCQTAEDFVIKRGVYSFTDFMTYGSETDRRDVSDICWSNDMDDPGVIYFTSGSTGIPKPTTLSHHAILNNIATAGVGYRTEVEGYDYKWESTRFAMSVIFSGAASFMGTFLPVVRGCTSIVLYPTFHAETMAQAIQKEKVTDGFFLIHHINDLLNLPDINDYDFSNLRSVSIGGSNIPYEMRQKVKEIAKFTTGIYGMTEILLTHMGHPFDSDDKLREAAYYSVGGVETKIVDEEGAIVPLNTTGEIHIRGYCLFMYYWGDEEKTSEFRDSNGWAHTGDLGRMDTDGYIQIRGRKKDLIIKQGLNLSPIELETRLYKHPLIKAAMVVGVPDARQGEEICACVTVEKDNSPTKDDIRNFCQGQVHELLVPHYVLFVEEFPTTATGKFSRVEMTEIAKEKLNIKP